MQKCLGCYEMKEEKDFIELSPLPIPQYVKLFYCLACTHSDRILDRKIDRILKNVKIPFYNTPIIKYKVPDINDKN